MPDHDLPKYKRRKYKRRRKYGFIAQSQEVFDKIYKNETLSKALQKQHDPAKFRLALKNLEQALIAGENYEVARALPCAA